MTIVELTPEGERLARRFLAALTALTAALRASWSRERQQLAVDLLTEISDALDASQQLPRRGRRLDGGRM